MSKSVLPAWQSLADGLEQLSDTGRTRGGLSQKPDGRQYYAWLVKESTGSSLSMDQLYLLLQKQFQKISLDSFREILIAGPKYKELASHICSLEELAEYPFVSLENNTSTRDLHIQYFSSHGFPFRPDLEVTSTDQCLALIQHNLGIGFYPEKLAEEPLKRGEILQIHLKESLPARHICLVQNASKPQSIAAQNVAIVSRRHDTARNAESEKKHPCNKKRPLSTVF